MRQSKVNSLLLELLIVVLFFSLVLSVAVRMFGTVHQLNAQADCTQEALFAGQELIEMLYAAEDPEAALASYAQQEGQWHLTTALQAQTTAGGTLYSGEVSGYQGEKVLFTLPFARYVQEARR